MTDRQFLERMTFLAQKLCDVTDSDGYGSDAYNAVLDEVHELGSTFNRNHRRRSWIASFTLFSLILFLLYIIYLIVSEV